MAKLFLPRPIFLAGKRAAAVVFAAVFLLEMQTVAKAVPIFTPAPPVLDVNFTGLTPGQSVSALNWTGNAGELANAVGAAPRSPLVNTHSTVLTVPATTAYSNIDSPAQTISPAFTTSNTLYFSAWINRSASASSGGRVFLQDANGVQFAGFTIEPAGPNRFGLMNTAGDWFYSASTESAAANTWYQLALVIEMNENDLAASQGYLFVRNVATETGFHTFPLTGLDGIERESISMGFSEDLNPIDFSSWELRIRNNVQIDNLAAGLGTVVIPEPSTASLALGVFLLGACWKMMRIAVPHAK